MTSSPIIVRRPTAHRRTSFEFYRGGLGFEPIGDLADDGIPEPLQFVLDDGVRIRPIPTGGFGWITGEHDVAPAGSSECVISINARDDASVDEVLERARRGGATIVTEPGASSVGLRRRVRLSRRPPLDDHLRRRVPAHLDRLCMDVGEPALLGTRRRSTAVRRSDHSAPRAPVSTTQTSCGLCPTVTPVQRRRPS